jgi:hypothetical protein
MAPPEQQQLWVLSGSGASAFCAGPYLQGKPYGSLPQKPRILEERARPGGVTGLASRITVMVTLLAFHRRAPPFPCRPWPKH